MTLSHAVEIKVQEACAGVGPGSVGLAVFGHAPPPAANSATKNSFAQHGWMARLI